MLRGAATHNEIDQGIIAAIQSNDDRELTVVRGKEFAENLRRVVPGLPGVDGNTMSARLASLVSSNYLVVDIRGQTRTYRLNPRRFT